MYFIVDVIFLRLSTHFSIQSHVHHITLIQLVQPYLPTLGFQTLHFFTSFIPKGAQAYPRTTEPQSLHSLTPERAPFDPLPSKVHPSVTAASSTTFACINVMARSWSYILSCIALSASGVRTPLLPRPMAKHTPKGYPLDPSTSAYG